MQPTKRFEYLLEQLTTLLVQANEYVTSHKKQFLKAEQQLKNQVTIQNFLYARLEEQYTNSDPSEGKELWTQELIHLCQVSDGEITKSNETFESSHTQLLSAYSLHDFIKVRIHELNAEYYSYINEFGKVIDNTESDSADSTITIQETQATADSQVVKAGDIVQLDRSHEQHELVSTIS